MSAAIPPKRRLSATLALALLCAAAISPAQQSGREELLRLGNGIAAIAEGEVITVEELRRELAPIVPRLRAEANNAKEFSQRLDDMSKEVLQNMIDRILIVKKAEEKGLMIPESFIDQEYDEVIASDFDGDRARFLEFLKQRGKTQREFREDIKKRVTVNVMRQQRRKSQSEISPERIEQFYLEHKIRFYQNEAIHLRQIILTPMADEGLAPLRQTANTIMKELENGAKFSDVAKKYGQDQMSRRGGDWGWVNREDVRTELSSTAFGLEPGKFSEPVELDGTIFILYCEDRREETIQPIRMVRDTIEEMLAGDIARENQEQWLRQLREDAYVRYFM